MATGLERPPWDTSKQSFNTVSPADKENRDYLAQLLEQFPGPAGPTGPAGPPGPPGQTGPEGPPGSGTTVTGEALSVFLNSLPKSPVGLAAGAWWDNGGIPTQVKV